MIVSDTHRFVFAHVPKTGGISVRAALEPFADGQAAVLGETTHETLPALLARQPRLAGHFKFAFVRNPWDRLVSFHVYARARLKPTLPQMQQVDFTGMLRQLDADAAWLRGIHAMRPQHAHVAGADFVGRFEDLDGEFGRVCARLDIAAVLPRKNASPHAPYAAYYDDWSRGFVAARYRTDIEQFGYAFEATS
jgi:chondroitin 4-sulfotransferase 11